MIDGQILFGYLICWGMVGGGFGSQIGYSYWLVVLCDGSFQLVVGVFDFDFECGCQFGVKFGVVVECCYFDYVMMFDVEVCCFDGICVVLIVMLNNMYFEICCVVLNVGLYVVCEKLLCFMIEEVEVLQCLLVEKNWIVGVVYGYLGYQMIEQVCEMIVCGDFGEICIVQMQFVYGFYSEGVEVVSVVVCWCVDLKFVGLSYVFGDIGMYLLYIFEVMVLVLKIWWLMCLWQSFVKSCVLFEDNVFMIMEYDIGVIGYVWLSVVNVGLMYGQKVCVIGLKVSIEWWDEYLNQLCYEIQGQFVQVFDCGMLYFYLYVLCEDCIGVGYLEGLFEVWLNFYVCFVFVMDVVDCGDMVVVKVICILDVYVGVEGVCWVENCVCLVDVGSVWVDYC